MPKKKSDYLPIGALIESFYKQHGHESKVRSVAIEQLWFSKMPKVTTSRTRKVYLKNDEILVVEINSASLKHQLTLDKAKILTFLHEEKEGRLIKDILFI